MSYSEQVGFVSVSAKALEEPEFRRGTVRKTAFAGISIVGRKLGFP